MLIVGLTGGIGSGKSTLGALLAERGARIVDADAIGRAALRPEEPAWRSVVREFGDGILDPDSKEIDRSRLAAIVFSERDKLAALNEIVHPVILSGVADALETLRPTDRVVVVDAALIVDLGLEDEVEVLIVVTADEGSRSERVMRARGMSYHEVRQRITAQAAPEELLAKADIVVPNDGSVDELASEADRVWAVLEDAHRAQRKQRGQRRGETQPSEDA
ncbi:MAG: dephospho-CoA kinase [Actinobacteria bacterium]|nr:dephospho-CoA kinase [Actinomycetota bacterium]